MKPVKVFVHDYAGHPFAVELSRELARRGHKVTHGYFTGDLGPKGRLSRIDGDPDTLDFAGIGIDGDYSKTSFVKRRFQDVAYGRAAAAAIAKAQPDIVLSGNTPTECQAAIFAAAKAQGAAFIYWCQDFYSIAASKILARKLPVAGHAIGLYYTTLERQQMRGSDAIVLITEDFAKQTRKWGIDDDRLHVVPNWGVIDQLPVLPKDNAWAREHGLADKLVFLYSGTLGLKHNPDFLAALAVRLKHDERVRVVVNAAGSGLDALKAEKQAKSIDNLLILGLQPIDRFAEVLATADIFAAVLERDAGVFSVPSKVLSYLCAGRPILMAAPAENLAARNVVSAGCGAIMEPEDMDGWLAAAEKLAADPELRTRQGLAGRAFAEANFSMDTVGDRFEQVLEDALRKAGRQAAR